MLQSGDKVIPLTKGGASYRDAKLNIDQQIARITPTLQSYLFEGGLHLINWVFFTLFYHYRQRRTHR